MNENLFGYSDFTRKATGSGDTEDSISVAVQVASCEVTVRLTRSGKFLGIEEVKLTRDALSQKLRPIPPAFFEEIDDFYPEISKE